MPHQAVEKVPIPKEVRDELANMETLSSIFPILIGNGRYNQITLTCPYCGASIGAEMQKGMVDRREHSVAISGFGICRECMVLAPFQVRLRDDGSMLFRQEHGWGERMAPTKGMLRGLIRFIMGGKNET